MLISRHLIQSVKQNFNAYRKALLPVLSVFSKIHVLHLILKTAHKDVEENDLLFIRTESAKLLFEAVKFADVESCYYNFINFPESESVIAFFHAMSEISK